MSGKLSILSMGIKRQPKQSKPKRATHKQMQATALQQNKRVSDIGRLWQALMLADVSFYDPESASADQSRSSQGHFCIGEQ